MVVDWIGVDWGTSNLRAFAFSSDGIVLEQRESAAGMGSLDRDEFEPALLSLIEGWLRDDDVMPIIACGMVGAREGWQEAPYRMVPAALSQVAATAKPATRDSRISMTILPGLAQAEPANVMRGEETQIAGFLSARPDFSGVICLPGTHSKWVDVSNGTVERFSTFMTGELFALLADQSILRHSIDRKTDDCVAFKAAALKTVSSKTGVMSELFSLRASGLVNSTNGKLPGSVLSGLLIGQEVREAKPMWQDKEVVLIGSDQLVDLYARVLKLIGTNARHLSGESAVVAGLKNTRSNLQVADT